MQSSPSSPTLRTRLVSAPGITITQRLCTHCEWWTSFPVLTTPLGYACIGCIPTLHHSLSRSGRVA